MNNSYFRLYAFRFRFNRPRQSPSRPSIPVQMLQQKLPYLGLGLGIAETRLVQPSIVTTTPVREELIFIPPDVVTEVAPQGIPIAAPTGFAVGEIASQPALPPASGTTSEIESADVPVAVPADVPVGGGVEPAWGVPQLVQTFDPNMASALPVLSLMSTGPKGPAGPSGPGGRFGGNFGNFGGPANPQGRGPWLIYILLMQILILLWLGQKILPKFHQLLEEYRKIRERWADVPVPPKDSDEFRKWLEQDRFYKFRDILLALATLLITPKLLIPVLRSLSNGWSRAILSRIIPFTRLIFICGLFLGTSAISLKALSSYLQPFYQHLFNCIQTGPSSNLPVFYMEVLLKCAAAGFLAGIICPNIFQWDSRDKSQNLLTFGVTAGCAIGIYAISQDGFYFSPISSQFWKTPVGSFFLKSQLGRVVLLLGFSRALVAVEELPYTAYFFIFFICVFQVYYLALTATPNLF